MKSERTRFQNRVLSLDKRAQQDSNLRPTA